jgi:hypothetical protein
MRSQLPKSPRCTRAAEACSGTAKGRPVQWPHIVGVHTYPNACAMIGVSIWGSADQGCHWRTLPTPAGQPSLRARPSSPPEVAPLGFRIDLACSFGLIARLGRLRLQARHDDSPYPHRRAIRHQLTAWRLSSSRISKQASSITPLRSSRRACAGAWRSGPETGGPFNIPVVVRATARTGCATVCLSSAAKRASRLWCSVARSLLATQCEDPIVPNVGRRLYVVSRKGRRVGN